MKALIIGSFSPPVNGVAVANEALFTGLSEKYSIQKINFSFPRLRSDLGRVTIAKAVWYLSRYIHGYKILLASCVYMTPGQTFNGLLKYGPFLLLSKILGKQAIVHVHGDHLWQEYQRLTGMRKKLFYRMLQSFDQGIVLSQTLRRNLSPFLPQNRIHVVENFVSEDIYREISLKTIDHKNTSELRILFLSNLIREKGILDLLQALVLVKAKGIPFRALIAGSMEPSIKRETETMLRSLAGLVTYTGPAYGKEKTKLLKEANVFVFPSYYPMEGQPIAVLEAMAAGNIILTTDHAGIKDIFVPSINGFFVAKQDPVALAEKLIETGRDLEGLTGLMKENQRIAGERFREQRFVDQIGKLLESCRT